MATPKDKLRVNLARLWISGVGGIAEASDITGISPRTLERFKAGKPPSTSLLIEMAEWIEMQTDTRSLKPEMINLSAQIRAAAQPAEGQADA